MLNGVPLGSKKGAIVNQNQVHADYLVFLIGLINTVSGVEATCESYD